MTRTWSAFILKMSFVLLLLSFVGKVKTYILGGETACVRLGLIGDEILSVCNFKKKNFFNAARDFKKFNEFRKFNK